MKLNAYHLYPIRIKPNSRGVSQRQAYDEMQKVGINVNLHYIPVYRQPHYETMGFKAGYCPEAEQYYQQAISIPMFAGLSDVEQEKVIQVLKDLLV